MAPETGVARIAGKHGVENTGRLRRLRARLGRFVAVASTAWLGLTVSAMAQMQNIYEQDSGSRFKAAPKSAEQQAAEEAAAADAAGESIDYIMGVHVNTIFFIAAGVLVVFWFTIGGGRKAKVSRH